MTEEDFSAGESLEKNILTLSESEKTDFRTDAQKLEPLDLLKKPEGGKAGVKASDEASCSDFIKDICSSIREYINGYIVLADTKAAFLIGISTAILTTTYSFGAKILEKHMNIWSFNDYFSFLGFIFLLLSILFSLFVVWPRTSIKKSKGLFSWLQTSAYNNVAEYLNEIFSANEKMLLESLYELNYDLSVVCNNKYAWLSRAFKACITGILFCAFYLLFLR